MRRPVCGDHKRLNREYKANKQQRPQNQGPPGPGVFKHPCAMSSTIPWMAIWFSIWVDAHSRKLWGLLTPLPGETWGCRNRQKLRWIWIWMLCVLYHTYLLQRVCLDWPEYLWRDCSVFFFIEFGVWFPCVLIILLQCQGYPPRLPVDPGLSHWTCPWPLCSIENLGQEARRPRFLFWLTGWPWASLSGHTPIKSNNHSSDPQTVLWYPKSLSAKAVWISSKTYL